MEKTIFMLLGLHLLPEQKLYWLILLISYTELSIMLFCDVKKKIFLLKNEIYYFLLLLLNDLAYTAFNVEHITFFLVYFM